MNRPTRIGLSLAAAAAVITPPVALLALPTAAGSATTAPTSATYSFSITIAGLPSTSSPVIIPGTITADLLHGQAEIAAQLPQALGPIQAGALDLIITGRTLYASAPGLSSLTGGKSWVSISSGRSLSDLNSATRRHRHGDISVRELMGNVPALLDQLTSTPAGHPVASVVSSTTTAGSTTTDLLIHPTQAHRSSTISSLPSSIPISLTNDADGRLTSATGSLSVGSLTISATIDSTSFDAPVSISAPAPSQTYVVPPAMLRMLAGSLGLMTTHTRPSGGLFSGAQSALGQLATTFGHKLGAVAHSLKAKLGL